MPFTREEFFAIFAAYNEAVWPVQAVLVLLAVGALVLIPNAQRWSDLAISAFLVLLWTWLALAYHLAFFARINPLALGFAALSLAAAAAFLWHGLIRRRLRFCWPGRWRGLSGAVLVAFALLAYPAWSVVAGHRYPAMPTFGLPCPTTIFTIGVLAFLAQPFPRAVFVVPALWCVIGGQAALWLDMPQDYALFVAGLAGFVMMFGNREPQNARREPGT